MVAVTNDVGTVIVVLVELVCIVDVAGGALVVNTVVTVVDWEIS